MLFNPEIQENLNSFNFIKFSIWALIPINFTTVVSSIDFGAVKINAEKFLELATFLRSVSTFLIKFSMKNSFSKEKIIQQVEKKK